MILHSDQQCIGVPAAPYPHQHLLFLILVIFVCVKWYLFSLLFVFSSWQMGKLPHWFFFVSTTTGECALRVWWLCECATQTSTWEEHNWWPNAAPLDLPSSSCQCPAKDWAEAYSCKARHCSNRQFWLQHSQLGGQTFYGPMLQSELLPPQSCLWPRPWPPSQVSTSPMVESQHSLPLLSLPVLQSFPPVTLPWVQLIPRWHLLLKGPKIAPGV